MTPKSQRDKLDPNSEKCALIGYTETATNYRLWNPRTDRVFTMTDVQFNEYRFTVAEGMEVAIDEPILEKMEAMIVAIQMLTPAVIEVETADTVEDDAVASQQLQHEIELHAARPPMIMLGEPLDEPVRNVLTDVPPRGDHGMPADQEAPREGKGT